MQIGDKTVGEDSPCFIIAEAGINHNNDIAVAKALIDAAAAAGCDAVKFQAFSAARMYPRSAGEIRWQDDRGAYCYDIYTANASFEVPDPWWPTLHAYARQRDLAFFASVFDESAADQVLPYCDILKVASFEITHLPLLAHIAQMGKPVMFSTGTATAEETAEAYAVVRRYTRDIIILHCISEYPVPLTRLNLEQMVMLKETFADCVIGFSDHSAESVEAAVAAVHLGARVIEKHITLDRRMKGPDHFFALEPAMLADMVRAVRQAEADRRRQRPIRVDPCLIGGRQRGFHASEQYLRSFVRRSVMTRRPLTKGSRLGAADLIVLRNGTKTPGLPPKWIDIIDRGNYRLTRDVPAEHPLQLEDIG